MGDLFESVAELRTVKDWVYIIEQRILLRSGWNYVERCDLEE